MQTNSAILQKIKQEEGVLVGPNSNDITKQKKCDKWKEVIELAESIRLAEAVQCVSDNLMVRMHPKGTRIVQADSGSDSDSESRRRSPRRLPAGWDRRV